MTCAGRHLCGAYVLGALSFAERRQLEDHLVHCSGCAQSVRELAGLPGLLAKVDGRVLEFPAAEDRPLVADLPSLVRDVRLARRRRIGAAVGVTAAVTATVAVGPLAGAGVSPVEPPRAPASVAAEGTDGRRQMVGFGAGPVHGWLSLESVPWGTGLALTCRYAARPRNGSRAPRRPAASYLMLVRTRDGRAEQVATWRGLTAGDMELAAATASRREEITAVEVRTTTGRKVLELTD